MDGQIGFDTAENEPCKPGNWHVENKGTNKSRTGIPAFCVLVYRYEKYRQTQAKVPAHGAEGRPDVPADNQPVPAPEQPLRAGSSSRRRGGALSGGA